MKIPTWLNVIRAILGVQIIFMGISLIFLIVELFNTDYSEVLAFDIVAHFASVLLRMILIIAPPIMTLVFISEQSYKLTITFMILTLLTVVLIPSVLVLLHFFMLLVLLLHKPSKMYLKQEGPPRDYNKSEMQL